MMRIQCPNPSCGQTCHVTETDLGRSTVCQKCGRAFVASGSPQAPHGPFDKTATALLSAPLSIDVSQATASVATAAASSDSGGMARSGTETVSADLPTPAIAPLTKLGRFAIRGQPLGAGAFGAVYRGYDPVLAREVALKVSHAGSLQTDKQKERFLREAKAAAQLRHPNIVPSVRSLVESNILRVEVSGRRIRLFVDGDHVGDCTAVRYRPGDLLLQVLAQQPPVDVRFERVRLWLDEANAPAPRVPRDMTGVSPTIDEPFDDTKLPTYGDRNSQSGYTDGDHFVLAKSAGMWWSEVIPREQITTDYVCEVEARLAETAAEG